MGNRYRLLALDVDGTLLSADGTLGQRTMRAVHAAADAGIQTVLCTGRRYRRALPVAEALGLSTPLICNSGALIKEMTSHKTLWRADFSPEILARVLELFAEHDEPVISFSDNPPQDSDFVVARVPMGRAEFDDYLEQNDGHAEVSERWTEQIREHYHVCGIGNLQSMLAMERSILDALPGLVQTFVQKSPRYAGTMCEVLRADASKWTALCHLADLWQIRADEICAIGDDMNDVHMIAGAGLGVAMGHSPDAVLAVANHITGDHHQDGVAMVIEDFLLSAS